MSRVGDYNNKRLFFNNAPLTVTVLKYDNGKVSGYLLGNSLAALPVHEKREDYILHQMTLYPVIKSTKEGTEIRLLTLRSRTVQLLDYVDGQFVEISNVIGDSTRTALQYFGVENIYSKYKISEALDAFISYSPRFFRDLAIYTERNNLDEMLSQINGEFQLEPIKMEEIPTLLKKFSEFMIKNNAELMVYHLQRKDVDKYLRVTKLPIAAKFDSIPNPLFTTEYRGEYIKEIKRLVGEVPSTAKLTRGTRGNTISPAIQNQTRIEYINIFKLYDSLEVKGAVGKFDIRQHLRIKEFIIKSVYESILNKKIFYKGGQIEYYSDGEVKRRVATDDEVLDPNYVSMKDIYIEQLLGPYFNNPGKLIRR